MQIPTTTMARSGTFALAALLASGFSAPADPAAGISGDVPPAVLDAIKNVEAKPVFAHATWGIHVAISPPAKC